MNVSEAHDVLGTQPRNVRFVPKADMSNCSKMAAYWITSSAVICMICGTVRPSTLAVLRLMTSSTFVGCCTGSSAGFSPLWIRST